MWDALFINIALVINQSNHRIIDPYTDQILLDDDYAVYTR